MPRESKLKTPDWILKGGKKPDKKKTEKTEMSEKAGNDSNDRSFYYSNWKNYKIFIMGQYKKNII